MNIPSMYVPSCTICIHAMSTHIHTFMSFAIYVCVYICVCINVYSVPDGKDEEDNIIVSEWGTHARKVGEHFLWHDDIALSLRGLDLPAAVRMSGSRFAVLTGQVARLERALTNYFLDFFTGLGGDTDGDGDSGGGDNHRRYEEVSVPLIVTRSTLESTGTSYYTMLCCVISYVS